MIRVYPSLSESIKSRGRDGGSRRASGGGGAREEYPSLSQAMEGASLGVRARHGWVQVWVCVLVMAGCKCVLVMAGCKFGCACSSWLGASACSSWLGASLGGLGSTRIVAWEMPRYPSRVITD